MTIREATHQDIPLLTRLIRDAFGEVAERLNLTPQRAPTHPSHCREEWVVSALDKGIRYYVLEETGTPVGCVALERAKPEIVYLERLAVLPPYQKKGFGKNLVRHALKTASEIGARRVEIAIIATETRLRNWYAGLGFVVGDTVHFDHLPFEVTFMAMDLHRGTCK